MGEVTMTKSREAVTSRLPDRIALRTPYVRNKRGTVIHHRDCKRVTANSNQWYWPEKFFITSDGRLHQAVEAVGADWLSFCKVCFK